MMNAILSCSPKAVSRLSSLNGETVAAGVVTCLIVYPLYLLVFTLFRMSRSKVTQTCSNPICVPSFLICHGSEMNLNIFFLSLCICEHQCVTVEQVPQQVDQESVEIDDFLDNSMAGSSFLFFNGEVKSVMKSEEVLLFPCEVISVCLCLYASIHPSSLFPQTNSEETNVDLPTPSTKR